MVTECAIAHRSAQESEWRNTRSGKKARCAKVEDRFPPPEVREYLRFLTNLAGPHGVVGRVGRAVGTRTSPNVGGCGILGRPAIGTTRNAEAGGGLGLGKALSARSREVCRPKTMTGRVSARAGGRWGSAESGGTAGGLEEKAVQGTTGPFKSRAAPRPQTSGCGSIGPGG